MDQAPETFGEVMASISNASVAPTQRSHGSRPVPSALPEDKLRWHRQQLQQLVTEHRADEHRRRNFCYLIGQQTLLESRAMKHPNFMVSTNADLQLMAEMYDHYFLGSHCLPLARQNGIHFRWSSRMTSNGGKTVRTVHTDRRSRRQHTTYEIVLSAPLLFQTFNDLERPIRVTGILCSNRLQAMQRIMEHELIHLVEMLVWDHSCCASMRFQSIARRLFGHTEHKHDLITQRERADHQIQHSRRHPRLLSVRGEAASRHRQSHYSPGHGAGRRPSRSALRRRPAISQVPTCRWPIWPPPTTASTLY